MAAESRGIWPFNKTIIEFLFYVSAHEAPQWLIILIRGDYSPCPLNP